MEKIAATFLEEHNGSQEIPVPIEKIVEFRLGYDIVPFPNLEKDRGHDAFLALGVKSIYIDQYQLQHQLTRFRFSLAHEVSHLILHKNLPGIEGIHSLGEYIDWYEKQDDEAYEWQARNLAGRILLPRAPLIKAAKNCMAKVPKDRHFKKEMLCSFLANPLGSMFEVSPKVAEIRLLEDGLWADVVKKESNADSVRARADDLDVPF